MTTPVGTLNYDVSGGSHFDLNGSTVPLDSDLYAANGDNINYWISGQTQMDFINLYPGFVRYQLLECSRVQFDVPAPPPFLLDTGWHCAQQEYLPDRPSLAYLAGVAHANESVSLDGVGNEDRGIWSGNQIDYWYEQGRSYDQPDFGPYVGMTLTGRVYSNACARIYLDVDYYPPGGQSGVNNQTGCVGSADPVSIGSMSFNSTSCGKSACKPTGPPQKVTLVVYDKNHCHVPFGLTGKTVAKAKAMLRAQQCRLGKVSFTRSKLVSRGRVIRPLIHADRSFAVGKRIPLLVSTGRR